MWTNLHCLYVDRLTLFICELIYYLFIFSLYVYPFTHFIILSFYKPYLWINLHFIKCSIFHCFLVEEFTIIICILYTWTSLKYLYIDPFKELYSGQSTKFICGVIYTVYVWNKLNVYMWNTLNSLCVKQFKLFVCGPVYNIYIWTILHWLYA